MLQNSVRETLNFVTKIIHECSTYIYILRFFRKQIYIAPHIYIFYGAKKNSYSMLQINAIALRQSTIDIDVAST